LGSSRAPEGESGGKAGKRESGKEKRSEEIRRDQKEMLRLSKCCQGCGRLKKRMRRGKPGNRVLAKLCGRRIVGG
jgi:hypothetical protein